MPTKREEYDHAKRAYHAAGKAAKGTGPNSAARAEYEKAKAAYRKAGRDLKAR